MTIADCRGGRNRDLQRDAVSLRAGFARRSALSVERQRPDRQTGRHPIRQHRVDHRQRPEDRRDVRGRPGAIRRPGARSASGISLACFQPGGTASRHDRHWRRRRRTSVIVNVSTPGCLFVVTAVPGQCSRSSAEPPSRRPISAASALGAPGSRAADADHRRLDDKCPRRRRRRHARPTACCARRRPRGRPARSSNVHRRISRRRPATCSRARTTSAPGSSNLPVTERTAGFLASESIVTFTISTAGVMFSTVPTVAITAASRGPHGPERHPSTPDGPAESVTRHRGPRRARSGSPTPTARVVHADAFRSGTTSRRPCRTGTLVNVALGHSGGVVVPTSRANPSVGRVFSASPPASPTSTSARTARWPAWSRWSKSWPASSPMARARTTCSRSAHGVTATFTAPGSVGQVVTGGVAAGNLVLRDGQRRRPNNIVSRHPGPGRPRLLLVDRLDQEHGRLDDPDRQRCRLPSARSSTSAVTSPAGTRQCQPRSSAAAHSALVSSQAAVHDRQRAVFRNQVNVTALAQPTMPAGVDSTRWPVTSRSQETGLGQLKTGRDICVEIDSQSGRLGQPGHAMPGHDLSGLNTADLPVATASGGVLVDAVRCHLRPELHRASLRGRRASLTDSVQVHWSPSSRRPATARSRSATSTTAT